MAAYGLLVSLKSTIEHCLKYYDICFTLPSPQMLHLLHSEVKSFEDFLNTSDTTARKMMDDRLNQTAVALSSFDDILKTYISKSKEGDTDLSSLSLDLEHVKEPFDAIVAALREIRHSYGAVSSDVRNSNLVGLTDQFNKLKQSIFLCRLVISVVGMAGNGKTTLAREIYRDLDIIDRFEYRAWIEVGRSYSEEVILQSILAQVGPSAYKMFIEEEEEEISEEEEEEENEDEDDNDDDEDEDEDKEEEEENEDEDDEEEEEISDYLQRSSKGNRFLIVFDDVSDVDFWYKLEYSLPTHNRGSKIVITTRSREVADGAGAVFDMRLLTNDESWDLLQEKVFGGATCPTELVKAGKKIAEYCDGLPLTIMSVFGLLSEADKTSEYWSQVAARKKHPLFLAAYDGIMEVLYPSYWDLSSQLRTCFLYMGVFPQEYEIRRSKITSLWVANEGLLDPIQDQYGQQFLLGFIGLEDFNELRNIPEQVLNLKSYATSYLEDLASKTLIVVYQKSTTRAEIRRSWFQGIKTCGLHSSWWHLCLKEARKRNIFYILSILEDGTSEDIKGQSTLCVHNNVLFGIKDVYESITENCASSARSLLCFGPYHQYQVPICFALRALEHLDALTIRFYDFPSEVIELVELRYLALTCNGKIPPSISKLSELRFFIIHRHSNIKFHGAPSYLPKEIWDMKELRHLEIMGSDLPSGTRFPKLTKLLHVSNLSCTKSVFMGMPKLRKLGIRIELGPITEPSSTYFDDISLLSGLQSLKCVVVNPDFTSKVGLVPPPSLPTLSLYLKKLTWSGLGLPWEETRKIASLEYLEVLKLRRNAFHGPKWEIEVYSFKKLEYLLIEDCDLEKLEMGSESLEDLHYLCLKHCYKLKEVYWESASLMSNIEVVDCNPLVEKRIKKAMLRSNDLVEDFSVFSSWTVKS